MKPKKAPAVSRRSVLRSGAGLALGGALAGATAASTSANATETEGKEAAADVYQALGVKHVINAAGTFTIFGGSLMPPEVVAAWAAASRHFVDVAELHDRVGQRIAKLVGVEAALVTTGAAGALLLGTAAAVTRGEAALVRRLPDTAGMKNEVLIQKSHHSCYDNQMLDVGVKLIEVETAADVRKVAGEKTALMFFMNHAAEQGRIGREEWIKLARRHRAPTLLDAAADVPPVERLSEYNKMGFDLVAFSGGKALRGPNDTGLLLGRRDLIEAGKKNANPHCGTIGRMMKVSKEDMVALLAAVERFVNLDHKAELQRLEQSIGVIERALKGVPTIGFERVTPAIANHVPHLIVTWDEKRVKVTREEVTRQLSAGEPSIRLGRVSGTGDRGLLISVLTLQPGEDRVVAARLEAILAKASAE
jgi:L-seryl-tRNA(Ser) seleniumtransferase